MTNEIENTFCEKKIKTNSDTKKWFFHSRRLLLFPLDVASIRCQIISNAIEESVSTRRNRNVKSKRIKAINPNIVKSTKTMAFAKAFQKLHRLPPNYYSSTSPLSAIATTRLSRTISTQTESSKKTILTFNRQSNALLQVRFLLNLHNFRPSIHCLLKHSFEFNWFTVSSRPSTVFG